MREWLPALAAAIGAPPPRQVPRWVARLMGEHGVALMCEVRGASNAKARRELGWTPRWPPGARASRRWALPRAGSSSFVTVFQLRAVAVTPSFCR